MLINLIPNARVRENCGLRITLASFLSAVNEARFRAQRQNATNNVPPAPVATPN